MTKPQSNVCEIRSPTGTEITAKSWATEAVALQDGATFYLNQN